MFLVLGYFVRMLGLSLVILLALVMEPRFHHRPDAGLKTHYGYDGGRRWAGLTNERYYYNSFSVVFVIVSVTVQKVTNEALRRSPAFCIP